MAWGGLIFATPPGATLDSLPSDYEMSSLGPSVEIQSALESLFPGHGHKRGQSEIQTETGWVELNYETEGDVTCMGVRSNADETVVPILQSVCYHFSARLFDNQAGDFAAPGGNSISSLADFRDFRDRNRQPNR